VPFLRCLGQVDEDDATNLPPGVASLARNTDYTYTGARTRAGIQRTMQGLNKSPITGLMGLSYTPESETENFFQLPTIFDKDGALQYESPVGTGNMKRYDLGLFVPPANAHMIGVQAYNRGYLAFSDLIKPASRCGVIDLKTKNVDPYGQKPFGWAWIANTACIIGEMATPSEIQDGTTVSVGNGHTYRCTVAGTTGATQPVWPLTENGIVVDGSVTWQEYTMVLANRIPQPDAPVLTRIGGGAFPAGQDVYILITLLNAQGETIASKASRIVNTNSGDAVSVAIPALASFPTWIQGLPSQYAVTGANVYEMDVATGSLEPPQTDYQSVGTFALGSAAVVTATASSGVFPPGRNSARVTSGRLPSPVLAPPLTRVTGSGAFPVGRDVYVRQSYTNNVGETTLGPSSYIIDTQLNDSVQVEIDGLAGFQLGGVNLYEADVPTGAEEPSAEQFALFGSFEPGDTATISSTASGPPAPTSNTTGVAGDIARNTETGGVNDSQGYRYAVPAFMNRNGSISGVTSGAVAQYIVDEDGWELAAFNVAVGPANVMRRIVGLTVANGVNAGPYGFLPETKLSDGVQILKTVIDDNVTTSLTMNFSDPQLTASIAAGEQLTTYFDVIWPEPCVDLYYSPTTDRMFQTGIPGFWSGHGVSNAGDAETYQASSGFIPIGANDGERTICVREYRGILFSLRERSGFQLNPNSADPRKWSATQRWSKVGPCGPRAVDTCGNFMIFVHRSGIQRYVDTEPELVSKENPYWWNTINWDAQETIWCAIDEEERVVRFGFPTGNSRVPNQQYKISYIEGWGYPLHFSVASGKVVSMDACRKVSVDDIAAFVAGRIERRLPAQPDPPMGDAGIDSPGAQQRTSQFVYGSSAADGAVHAITPGIFNDNGAGIDWRYRTTSAGVMQALSKAEGFNLNARGNGSINASFYAARDMRIDWESAGTTRELRVRPFDLSLNQSSGISRNVESRLNEHWVLEFNNGKVADAWCELKSLYIYILPMFTGREAGER
jgi:hypothetical protein